MDFYMKLPRNKKEFTLFLAIISILSVNLLAPFITCLEMGFRWSVYVSVLHIIPFIWVCVVLLVFLTQKPANWLTNQLVAEGDSFSAHITIHILCNVLFMSVFLTIIGTWIGSGQITWDPITTFFYKWPRNFAVSFGVEGLIAQPIARFVMVKLHQWQERKGKTVAA